MRTLLFATALAALLATGCSNDDNTTTPTTPTPTSPTTSTFTTTLTPSGAVSRLFTATTAGAVSVTLTSAGPANPRLGLGIGVPAPGVARCSLSTAITTVPGGAPQIQASVDPGNYCVVVYDIGALTDEITFDLTLVYP